MSMILKRNYCWTLDSENNNVLIYSDPSAFFRDSLVSSNTEVSPHAAIEMCRDKNTTLDVTRVREPDKKETLLAIFEQLCIPSTMIIR